MKIRLGFVSNSSSSSFICDFCGSVVSDRDLSMEDAGMLTCENGHVFCNEETDFSCDDLSEDFIKELKEYAKDRKYWGSDNLSKDFISKIDAVLSGDLSVDEFKTYLYEEDIIYAIKYEWGIPEKYCPVCNRKHKMEQDEDYIKYKELYEKFEGITPDGRTTSYSEV